MRRWLRFTGAILTACAGAVGLAGDQALADRLAWLALLWGQEWRET